MFYLGVADAESGMNGAPHTPTSPLTDRLAASAAADDDLGTHSGGAT